MNKYEKIFFGKFIPEWSEVKYIVHEHVIVIFNRLIILFLLFVFIPSFFYYNSIKLQNIIPFYIIEIYLILMFIKIVYDIFDWYNDAWIITENSVIDFKWALLWIKSNSVDFESIEWIEVEQEWILDKFLWKWAITIHKVWDEVFTLKEALVPFSALEEIELIKEEHEKQNKEEHEKGEKDKFDIVMEALTWVVHNYLHENTWKSHKKWKNDEKHENFLKIKQKKWTIDLRGNQDDEKEDDVEKEDKHNSHSKNQHWHDKHWSHWWWGHHWH